MREALLATPFWLMLDCALAVPGLTRYLKGLRTSNKLRKPLCETLLKLDSIRNSSTGVRYAV